MLKKLDRIKIRLEKLERLFFLLTQQWKVVR